MKQLKVLSCVFGFVCLPGCLKRTGISVSQVPSPVSVEAILRESPIRPGESVKAVEVYRTPAESFHVVQVSGQEKPHRHDRHDLGGLLLHGRGTLFVDGAPYKLTEGSFFYVARGTPHYFVNEAEGVSSAWVIFSPAFDKRDIVPVSAGESPR